MSLYLKSLLLSLLILVFVLFATKESKWPVSTHQGFIASDTLRLQTDQSVLTWKGTKMAGLGKHEGTVDLNNGYLIKSGNGKYVGEIVVDMKTIEATDIPVHETVPRKRLVEHLKSEDFFHVSKFQFSVLRISTMVVDGEKATIDAMLEIKGKSLPVRFTGNFRERILTGKMSLDRFRWDIAYRGNWLDRTFVDRKFTLGYSLVFY